MGFKCGIIGLPNVGKSTIFNALTAQQVPASNYPFCTVEPNHGIVPLADSRLETIQAAFGSARRVPTTLEFVDIAGLVQGASQGEGLGNQFLSNIQQVDALAHVVRCFEEANVAHITAELDPVRDAEIVNLELALKDLETVGKRLEATRRHILAGDKVAQHEIELLQAMHNRLNQGELIAAMNLSVEELATLQPLNLLTAKPMLYLANVDENHQQDNPFVARLGQFAQQQHTPLVQFCGKAQAEIAQLDAENQKIFLAELSQDELGLDKLTRAGYQLLRLITFFTANQNEAHAWTVSQGTNVQQAAGKIHSDFAAGFIRAEVIKYKDLATLGSETALRSQGLVAVHGRDYLVQDGDIVFYRFHV